MAESLQSGLHVRELACTRAGRLVFSGLSFELLPGEMMEVRGANGSGKSSLLRLLCGLLPRQSGELQWRGRSIASPAARLAGETAYLGHADGLRGELTLRENLHFALHMSGVRPDATACREVLARLRLAPREDEQVRLLSQGQRRRLALARVLLCRRPLWLLDEPHAGLDADGEQALEASLAEHTRQGGLALIATHRTRAAGPAQPRCIEMDALERCEPSPSR